ncbi:MAG TPA: DUF1552 domain-containing protein [Steroidobacteraceae bacterium]|jgi:hypothetical protein|nr:DUF1552 domain-containing protein [Steroidobacteraceae bacterium]
MKKQLTYDRAAQRHDSLSRRQVLRGLGASIALPTLMSASPAFARSLPKQVPARMAFVYVPNGAVPAAWWPEGGGGADFALSPTLAPLAKVRNSLQVISGLDCVSAEAGPDGAGDHARAGGTFLTGVRIKKTAGSDIKAGISIDQVVANEIGHHTRFASLELTCDVVRKSGECDSGYACAYEYNLAWSAPNQPLAPEHNPQFAFERLFGDGARNERVANLKRRESEQHSILDYVLEDAKSLNAKLDGRDRQKLDQYLTSVREIEQRIAISRTMPVANPDVDAPAGVPPNYSDHVALMFDMLLLAFQTDSTRIATLLLAREGSNRPFNDIGISSGHHDLSHHKNTPDIVEKVKLIDRWYVERLAAFLEKMDQTEEADGKSLLHHSMILYGSGNADGNRHTHVNLPVVLAGTGGGAFKPGRYIKAKSQPIPNLFLSMADAMGTNIPAHGDSTGRFSA